VNLFPAEFPYHNAVSEFDSVDFLEPHERKPRTYAILPNPKGDIDKTLGYQGSEYITTPDLALLRVPNHAVQITWIQHATFFIQFGGKFQILTDPVLAPIDGMVGFFMQFFDTFKAYAKSPVTLKEVSLGNESDGHSLKQTNITVISHDHFDHLNWNTINALPTSTHFYVPLGLEKDFPSRFPGVTGMDWYTKDALGELDIHFLPANHRSGRSLSYSNKTLWGGWLFEWNNRRVYFSGDTGYSPVFKDIAERLGEIDVCLMPISAWFQRNWHFAPEDAIRAAQDLGCKIFIPWGYGTWIMSYEHILEPVRRLEYAWTRMRPKNMELRILKMGETLALGAPLKSLVLDAANASPASVAD
jgi:L-ascorbate metabolism protein UlaG (beta-lactamase superfamily)